MRIIVEVKNMQNAKTGLKMLSFSIILNLIWIIVNTILTPILTSANATLITITSVVSLVCYVIELIALFKAGKDNARFKKAARIKIFNIVVAVLSIVFSAVGTALIKNETIAGIVAIVLLILLVISFILEFVALFSIIKGCREIAPRVSGNSRLVSFFFVVYIIFSIVTSIVGAFPVVAVVSIVFGVISSVAAILFSIFYLLLIFRTTHNVGKAK